jgi:hypothetical protein
METARFHEAPATCTLGGRVSMLRRATFLLALLAAGAAGCASPPVLGVWRSDDKLGNGERNKLVVNEDFTGSATIYATPKGQPQSWQKFKFDVAWEDEVEEFDFKMKCASDACTDADEFTMECQAIEMDDGAYKMDCDGNKRWADYPFDWELAEEL